MPVDKESKVVAWLHALREYAPSVRVRAAEGWEHFRENPALIWQHPVTRYGAVIVAGVAVILILRTVIGSLTPPLPEGAGEASNTAVFYVICNNPACAKHGQPTAIKRKHSFDRFPVKCTHCGQKTCHRAFRATSGPHKGEWLIEE